MLSATLEKDPSIEVVGQAIDGKFALQKIEECNPDLVTLDIEMPGQDGVTTLKEIRKVHRTIPVIMFSTLTERGARWTLDALSAGATDYVAKPSNRGNVEAVVASIHEQLVPKIKASVGRKFHQHSTGLVARPARAAAAATTRAQGSSQRPSLLAIGVSTGGPNALTEVLPQLPADFPVPIVIVQHMPPTFTRLLAERLDARCKLSVCEAQGGEVLKAGHAYIAPGDHHMIVEAKGGGYALVLNQDPQENSCRPAVDPLFRSVAKHFGAKALAVVLTGMGSDGFKGGQVLTQAGGELWAQDEATSVVWGMPGYVANAGLASKVLPITSFAQELIARVGGRSPVGAGGRH